MIRLPAIGRPLFRCRLCGWLGPVEPELATSTLFCPPQPAILGLPEWAMHQCDEKRVGVADLVGFERPADEDGS